MQVNAFGQKTEPVIKQADNIRNYEKQKEIQHKSHPRSSDGIDYFQEAQRDFIPTDHCYEKQ